jgi:hypothetical protein
MLRGRHFHKIVAWTGLLASLITFADDLSIVVAPGLATPLMIASGLLWIPWWVMIGVNLFQFARRPENFT